MSGISQFFLHLIFIAAFAFFFLLAILLLKPLRFHQKRKVSTALLKFSYLTYLLLFLLYIYLFLFFQEPLDELEEEPEEQGFKYSYVLLLLAFFIPNVGMLIRRKFKKWRTAYNYLFTGANLLVLLYLVAMIWLTSWTF